jgi:hypothetical protein
MTLLRASIRSTNPEHHEEALTIIEEIEPHVRHVDDQHRLNNYKILTLLRLGKTTAALNVGRDRLTAGSTRAEEPSDEDFYHASRAAAEAALRDKRSDREKIEDVYEQLRETPSENETGHPNDLIWRELGLIEHALNEEKGEALRCFRRSGQALREFDSSVPAIAWRHFLLDQHEDYIEGGEESLYTLYEETKNRSFAHLVGAALGQHSEATPLRALRAVSPA